MSEVSPVGKTSSAVRREFLAFFRGKQHQIVPGSPVVPYDDPTLMFTNAGMNQFKDVFLGTGQRDYTRAADSQVCIRAGGKHNDLDDVGADTYHQTLFEMLGNWSFGDYFKKEAIEWAWELLTEVWGLDKRRLHATYFGGDDEDGLEADDEARQLWLDCTDIPRDHVHPFGKKDNFWEMGDTGPCGPCSEIHVDLTPDGSGAALVNADDPRVIEIWNLVFIQFNRDSSGRLTPLPAKHVDTGMGFERITSVLQGHNNNYGTDVFVPIIAALEQRTGHTYGGGVSAPPAGHRYAAMDPDCPKDLACRVIADHIRTLVFAIADGAVPDKDGRGYVLRRILRRAVRFGWQSLELREPFLCQLVPTVVDVMGDAFPHVRENPRIADLIRDEEQSFARTLDRGIALFEQAAERARAGDGRIHGADAFKLHDTFGFPVDLTEIMAAEAGLQVDHDDYVKRMEAARAMARAGGNAEDDPFESLCSPDRMPDETCDDSPKFDPSLTCQATIRSLIHDGDLLEGGHVVVTLDRTCFYAEQGGQVADTGTIDTGHALVEVHDTRRAGGTVLHCGVLKHGRIRIGETATLTVADTRRATMRNHTATHLLNYALRETLGEHVQQKGSLVDADRTRFDLSHPKGIDDQQLRRIENIVNEQVQANHEVFAEEADLADARQINGLRAVFGEKYPDRVRVVSIGAAVGDLLARPDSPDWQQYSIEFCGGTHVPRTGEIDAFALTAEESVAKGVRRVVGVTGEAARNAHTACADLFKRVSALIEKPPADVGKVANQLQDEINRTTYALSMRGQLLEALEQLKVIAKKQQKQAAAASSDEVKGHIDELIAAGEKVGETTIVVGELPDVDVDALKTGADIVKQKCGSAAVLFGVRSGGKALLLAAVSPDLVKRGIKAGDLVKEAAKRVKGGGGGPPTMAQAGGKDPSQMPSALEAGQAWIRERLGS